MRLGIAIEVLVGGMLLWRIQAFRPRLPAFTKEDVPYALAIGSTLVVLASCALWWPPNNWDSMTYHMARVAQWIQNGSIEFYPTFNHRQLSSPPLAEYTVLASCLVSGGDIFANLVQWGCYLLCILSAMEATGAMGGHRRAMWMAGLLVCSLPMAILQATSTQNDLVASFFFLCAATELILMPLNTGWKHPWWTGFWIGASVGLGLLTKGTSFLYFPLLLALGMYQLMARKPWIEAAIAVILSTAISLAIVAPHSMRQYRNSATILPSEPGQQVEHPTVSTFLSIGLRNAAIHLQIPHLVPRAIVTTNYATRALSSVNDWLHVDSRSPETSFDPESKAFIPFEIWVHEDYSGNPLHFVLLLLLLPWSLWIHRKQRSMLASSTRIWIASIIGAAMVLCLLVKWQVWGSRLHISLFVASMPVLGMELARIRWARWLPLLLWAFSWSWIGNNFLRPWPPPAYLQQTTRLERMFMARFALLNGTVRAAGLSDSLACGRIGLILEGEAWEYPLHVATKARVANSRLVHIRPDSTAGYCMIVLSKEVRLPDALRSPEWVIDSGTAFNFAYPKKK